MRSFIGIGLDERTRGEIVAFTAPLQKLGLAVRWTPEANLHLTLQFLGEIDGPQQSAITAALAAPGLDIPPFSLRFRGAGAFQRNGEVSIVWIGSEPCPELLRLVARLGERLTPLGFPPESRPFTPHLTVGRSRGRCPGARLEPTLQALAARPVTSVAVTGFSLFQSRMQPGGSVYTPLREFPLG
ncbi:MAG TPA: RNA 2',3'-cyclic phosphodiesterase [Candidatus Aminicenantes bacterium]|nr:RNA 2',3'-cyclic phosphodiesterase [Candidatus Aminicenantes bacterium]